ncbi:Histidine kinase [Ruminococcaceae bacterium YRB3002]|nr:Histidine kinase [Ruminococcaceae bacterium YRB3002]
MNDWLSMLNHSILIAGLTIALLGLILALSIRHMDRWNRNFFLVFFSTLVVYIGFNTVCHLSLMDVPDDLLLSQTTMYIYSFISPLLIAMVAFYLVRVCGENWRRSPLIWFSLIMVAIYQILLTSTWFTDYIYYFVPGDGYNRGRYYSALLIPPVINIALVLTGILRRKSKLTPKHFTALLTFVVTPFVCTILQMFSSGVLLVILGTSISALFMFVYVLFDQVENTVRQTEENAMQKASIMKLQMRPHFIFNTMMSIYYLCEQDPGKAQNVILDFTTYLRKNFTAIANEDTIPFSEELEHTKAYLGVEQVRYDGRITVCYDIQHTLFRIPPLTLQPIVENSVKHGIDPDKESLSITIHTTKESKQTVIKVEDNGTGFDGTDNDDPHIALNNIRQRLQMICKGTLSISERDGGGTVVTVAIPE